MAKQSVTKKRTSPWATGKERAAAEREQKREAVLHVAAQAFAENGYYRTSLEEIAERLGVSKPTIYYYAKNKEELLEAVIERALERVLSVDPADTYASSLERLKIFLRHYVEVNADDFGRCLLQLGQSDLAEAATTRVRESLRIVDLRIRSLLKEGVADGSIAPCDTKLTGFMLASALNGIQRWHDPAGELSVASAGEILINQMLTGLVPR